MDGGDATTQIIFAASSSLGGAADRFLFSRTSGNKLSITAQDSAGVARLSIATSASVTSGAAWHHLLSSWDLAAGVAHLYLDGVSDLVTTTNSNANIDYTAADWSIGLGPNSASRFNGCLAESYFAQGQFLDFSIPSNRAKFRSAAGKPADLNATNGSKPTGSQPTWYARNPEGTGVGQNAGSGGGMSCGGATTTCPTSPSD
jgi:hypothetical protein